MTIGIRKKVIFISVAILFLALAATTTVSSVFFMREYSAALKSRAFLVGSILKYQLEKLLKYDIPLNELVGFDEQCQEIINNYGDISYAMVVDLKGKILFHNKLLKYEEMVNYKNIPEILGKNKEGLQKYSKNGENYYSFIIPVRGLQNTPIAAVIIGFPASLITHKTAEMVAYSVGVAVIFLTVGGISMIILLRFWVTTPLSQLLKAIMNIQSSGTDSAQLLIIRSKDEFGELGRAFNEMVLQLKESQARVQNYTQELEFKVTESTAHLKDANEKLQQDIQVRLQAEAALRESEEKYRGLIETTRTGYVIIDTEGKVLDANQEYVRLTGHTELERILGRSVLEWTALADREISAAAIKHCLQNGIVRNLELHYAGRDGWSVPVEINATVISASAGVKFLALVRDISDRKQTEEEKAKLEAQLAQAQKMEAIGTLAGGIAHDFNNILTAIIGNISLAILDLERKGPAWERLSEAERACMQAQNLSRQLLTFSKGGAPIKKIVSVKEIVTEAASFACRGSRVNYGTILPDDLWAVEADPGQISQVFQNLVINAIQAMPTGGMIKIRGENLLLEAGSELPLARGRYVKVSVQDEGIGISADHLTKVFEPYFTTKNKGSGLGLATSYSIIKNHHGHISAVSKIEHGSTFNVYLPASDQKAILKLQEDPTLMRGKGKILIMDDESMVREVLGKMLLALGYEVKFAEDGAKAIELYARAQDRRDPFVTVILDLTVPGGMGGKEAMDRLLKIDPQVKAIVSSGYSDDPIMANYQRYGFTDVIAKPYKISEVAKVLNKAIAEEN